MTWVPGIESPRCPPPPTKKERDSAIQTITFPDGSTHIWKAINMKSPSDSYYKPQQPAPFNLRYVVRDGLVYIEPQPKEPRP